MMNRAIENLSTRVFIMIKKQFSPTEWRITTADDDKEFKALRQIEKLIE
jgi:hypothetical protein